MCTDVYSLASPVILPCGRERQTALSFSAMLRLSLTGTDRCRGRKTSAEEENTVVSADEQPASDDNAEITAEEQETEENKQDKAQE